MEEKRFADLVGLLYGGLLSPDGWNDFLAELAKQLECTSASLSVHDVRNRTPTVAFSVGLSQDEMSEWTNYYGRENPRAPEVLRTALRTGVWFSATSLSNIPVSYRSTEYAQWLRRCDKYHAMIAAVPCVPAVASLNLIRNRSAKPFGETPQKVLKELIPHLRRVLQVHSKNETACALFAAGKTALNALDAAVVALDQDGRIVMASERAERVLSKQEGITADGGKLRARHPSEARRLQSLIRSAVMTGRGGGTANGGVVTIHGEVGSAPMSIVVTPFRSNHSFAQGRPCALAYIYDPAAKPGSRAQALRATYGLTPAECLLADLLHAGLELRAAAGHLRVTEGTARFMLKKIFAKTGLHRQAELGQLLSRLPGDVRVDDVSKVC